MRNISKILGLLLLLPLFTGCNDSDDVACYLYRENLETKLHHCGWRT